VVEAERVAVHVEEDGHDEGRRAFVAVDERLILGKREPVRCSLLCAMAS